MEILVIHQRFRLHSAFRVWGDVSLKSQEPQSYNKSIGVFLGLRSLRLNWRFFFMITLLLSAGSLAMRSSYTECRQLQIYLGTDRAQSVNHWLFRTFWRRIKSPLMNDMYGCLACAVFKACDIHLDHLCERVYLDSSSIFNSSRGSTSHFQGFESCLSAFSPCSNRVCASIIRRSRL